jgi:hypothetical protein
VHGVQQAAFVGAERGAEIGAVHHSQLEATPGLGLVGGEHFQGPGVVRRNQNVVRIAMSKVAIQAGEMLFHHV